MSHKRIKKTLYLSLVVSLNEGDIVLPDDLKNVLYEHPNGNEKRAAMKASTKWGRLWPGNPPTVPYEISSELCKYIIKVYRIAS